MGEHGTPSIPSFHRAPRLPRQGDRPIIPMEIQSDEKDDGKKLKQEKYAFFDIEVPLQEITVSFVN